MDRITDTQKVGHSHGIRGTSDRIRQFLTTQSNDLDRDLLEVLAAEFNDPVGRARRDAKMRERMNRIRQDLDRVPDDTDSPEP